MFCCCLSNNSELGHEVEKIHDGQECRDLDSNSKVPMPHCRLDACEDTLLPPQPAQTSHPDASQLPYIWPSSNLQSRPDEAPMLWPTKQQMDSQSEASCETNVMPQHFPAGWATTEAIVSNEGLWTKPSKSPGIDTIINARVLEVGMQGRWSDGVVLGDSLEKAETGQVRSVSLRSPDQMVGKRSSWRSLWPIRGNNKDLAVHWAFKLQEGRIYGTFSTEFESGISMIRAVAALCELNSYKSFNDDIVSAMPLAKKQVGNHCIWRLISHNKKLNIKTDNIWEVTVTDVLETHGSITVELNVPETDAQCLKGLDIPPPKEGFTRISEGHVIYSLQPVIADGSSSMTGFNLTQQAFTRPAKTNFNLLYVMPFFVKSRLLKTGLEDTVGRLKHHIRHSSEVDDALKSSSRAELYAEIEVHLNEWVSVAAQVSHASSDYYASDGAETQM